MEVSIRIGDNLDGNPDWMKSRYLGQSAFQVTFGSKMDVLRSSAIRPQS